MALVAWPINNRTGRLFLPAALDDDGNLVTNGQNHGHVTTFNSYIALADAIGHLVDRGFHDSTIADSVYEQLLALGKDYVDSFVDSYSGDISFDLQTTAWPRDGVYARGKTLDSFAIPYQIGLAQALAAYYILQDIDPLAGRDSSGFLTELRVGPIGAKYGQQVAEQIGVEAQIPRVDALLDPYFGGGGLRLVRR